MITVSPVLALLMVSVPTGRRRVLRVSRLSRIAMRETVTGILIHEGRKQLDGAQLKSRVPFQGSVS
jgi:hypothetical protein